MPLPIQFNPLRMQEILNYLVIPSLNDQSVALRLSIRSRDFDVRRGLSGWLLIVGDVGGEYCVLVGECGGDLLGGDYVISSAPPPSARIHRAPLARAANCRPCHPRRALP